MTVNSLPPNNLSLCEFVPKKKFAESEECPITEPEFNWLFKQRERNGFAKAFAKVSERNYLVHIPSFIECLNKKRGT